VKEPHPAITTLYFSRKYQTMKWWSTGVLLLVMMHAQAQLFDNKESFTHADTIRGSITPERSWWNVTHYDLTIRFNEENKTLEGKNTISFRVEDTGSSMQIDLMQPLEVDRVLLDGEPVSISRHDDVFYLQTPSLANGSIHKLEISYHGKPRVARLPPWDGGVIWSRDHNGNSWISVACQGLGASVWYPNKDHQSDEPDSAAMHIITNKGQTAVSNGRFRGMTENADGSLTWNWAVVNPINNYNLIPYIGKYEDHHSTYQGEAGTLDVDMWFLEGHMDQAISHVLPDINKTLEAFEYWFGPYPFYEDGFKMVEAPHLGMEHQSAIAYGNKFKKGYLGGDLSGTGEGDDWDYIVVHESGHEWFGNNITTKDIADMWVHEGFTDYSETLFIEYWKGKDAADKYVRGLRKNISNDEPVIGPYLVNTEGSGDMYYKGANLLHTIRQVIDNDSLFRDILRGLNHDFYHQTVTSLMVEDYISRKAGMDLGRIFTQYLRTTHIPVFDYHFEDGKSGPVLVYRWANIVKGMNMPYDIQVDDQLVRLYPSQEYQYYDLPAGFDTRKNISGNLDYYVLTQRSGK